MQPNTLIKSLMVSAMITGSASAATIADQQSFSGTAGLAFDLDNIDSFDTSLGTLTGVNVQIIFATSGGLAEADNDGSAGSVTVNYAVGGTLTGDQAIVDGAFQTDYAATSVLSSDSASLGADDDGPGFQSGGADYFSFVPAGGGTTDGADLSGLVISQYEDTTAGATLGFTYTTTSQITGVADGAVSLATSPANVNGTVVVTYTYDAVAVPEPTSAVLLGLGGVVGLLRRRRS